MDLPEVAPGVPYVLGVGVRRPELRHVLADLGQVPSEGVQPEAVPLHGVTGRVAVLPQQVSVSMLGDQHPQVALRRCHG